MLLELSFCSLTPSCRQAMHAQSLSVQWNINGVNWLEVETKRISLKRETSHFASLMHYGYHFPVAWNFTHTLREECVHSRAL
jgi:hypothetical protein